MDAFERLKAAAAKADIKHPPKALELPMPKIPDPAVAKAALEVCWQLAHVCILCVQC